MVEAKIVETLSLRTHGSRYHFRDRRRLSGPAMRTFAAIADSWGLNTVERRHLLGTNSRYAYCRWERSARDHGRLTLTVEALSRISVALGIHRSFAVLFAEPADVKGWVRRPHEAHPFDGRLPIELMMRGGLEGLLAVLRFLKGASQGIYMLPNSIDTEFQPYNDDEILIRATDADLVEKLKTIAAEAEAGETVDATGLPMDQLRELLFPQETGNGGELADDN